MQIYSNLLNNDAFLKAAADGKMFCNAQFHDFLAKARATPNSNPIPAPKFAFMISKLAEYLQTMSGMPMPATSAAATRDPREGEPFYNIWLNLVVSNADGRKFFATHPATRVGQPPKTTVVSIAVSEKVRHLSFLKVTEKWAATPVASIIHGA